MSKSRASKRPKPYGLTPKRLDAFKQGLKTLKSFGFVDWDLRKPLTEYKAKRAVKLFKEHGHIIREPDQFVKRKVSKETKAKWTEHGFDSSKKYLIIDKNGYETIHVSKEKLVRRNYEKKEVIYSDTGLDLYNRLARSFKRPLRTHEYITIKIGNSAPFHTRFNDMSVLMNYIGGWTPKDIGEKKDNLISQMRIVRFFDYEELREYGEESDYEPED